MGKLWVNVRGMLLVLLIVGCTTQSNQIALPIDAPSKNIRKQILPEIPDLSQAHTIQIHDDWAGLSELAPVQANFFLERKDNGFVGAADFEAGGYSVIGPLTATADLVIPLGEAQVFLQLLAEPSLKRNVHIRYLPFETDNYPNRSITVTVENWSVVFHYEPIKYADSAWHFSTYPTNICEIDCLTFSDAPDNAINILEPYLQRETQVELFDEIYRRVRYFYEP